MIVRPRFDFSGPRRYLNKIAMDLKAIQEMSD
jgi:hypothetical protein